MTELFTDKINQCYVFEILKLIFEVNALSTFISSKLSYSKVWKKIKIFINNFG